MQTKQKTKQNYWNCSPKPGNDLYTCIKSIDTDDLLLSRPVQVYEENGTAILIHVTEHFSYHTGQIAFLTKWLKDQQTHFYEGIENK